MKKYSKFVDKDVGAVLEPINSDNIDLIYVTKENLVDSLIRLIPDIYLPSQITIEDIAQKVCSDIEEHTTESQGSKIKHTLNVETLCGFDTYHSLDEFLKVDAIKHSKCHVLLLADGTETVCVEIETQRIEIAKVIYGTLKELFLYDTSAGLEVFEVTEVIKSVKKPTSLMVKAIGML